MEGGRKVKKDSFYAFRELGSKSKFQSFALEIVAGCQLKCGNCYRLPQKKVDPMPSHFISRVIMEAKESGFAEVVFIGGEPTLHPDLPQHTEKALEDGLAPILCTNGVRLAEKKYCEQVIFEGMTVVIHGLIQASDKIMDQHVNVDGYKGKLQKAYANLNELRKRRNFTIVAEAVVIKPFLPHLLDFHKECRKNNYVPFIELNRRGNNGCENKLSVSPEEVRNIFLQLQEWDYANATRLADKLLTPPAYGNKCTMSITGLHVKNFGNGDYSGVYSCCAQSICHGDLREKTLSEIMADPSVQIYKDQDKWIAGPCQQCGHYSICRGGCRGEAILAFGCPRASCPSCWHIPPEIRKDFARMRPLDCFGCPLEHHFGCQKN